MIITLFEDLVMLLKKGEVHVLFCLMFIKVTVVLLNFCYFKQHLIHIYIFSPFLFIIFVNKN